MWRPNDWAKHFEEIGNPDFREVFDRGADAILEALEERRIVKMSRLPFYKVDVYALVDNIWITCTSALIKDKGYLVFIPEEVQGESKKEPEKAKPTPEMLIAEILAANPQLVIGGVKLIRNALKNLGILPWKI